MINSAKIAISLPKELLRQIDQIVKERGQSRSAVVRLAINNMIRYYLEQKALKRARQIYKEIDKSEKRLSEEFLSISRDTFPTMK